MRVPSNQRHPLNSSLHTLFWPLWPWLQQHTTHGHAGLTSPWLRSTDLGESPADGSGIYLNPARFVLVDLEHLVLRASTRHHTVTSNKIHQHPGTVGRTLKPFELWNSGVLEPCRKDVHGNGSIPTARSAPSINHWPSEFFFPSFPFKPPFFLLPFTFISIIVLLFSSICSLSFLTFCHFCLFVFQPLISLVFSFCSLSFSSTNYFFFYLFLPPPPIILFSNVHSFYSFSFKHQTFFLFFKLFFSFYFKFLFLFFFQIFLSFLNFNSFHCFSI